MMTAWKVSGLWHRPAIIASRPAAMGAVLDTVTSLMGIPV